jgi:acetyl-CoA C-acetyltransferase
VTEVVILDATRTPIGKRGGWLSGLHPADLLGQALTGVLRRADLDPGAVDQVITGCVAQVGSQAFNIARTAWLAAGLPDAVPASTLDAQCGSSQQAFNLAASLVTSGSADVVIAAGVEMMSRVQVADATRAPGRPFSKSYLVRYEPTSQFEGAERIATKWGVTRDDCDRFGLASHRRALAAQEQGTFAREITPVMAPVLDKAGEPTGAVTEVGRDQGPRPSSLERLGELTPVAREDGVHTAGSSAQIADGAAAAILASRKVADARGWAYRARVSHQTLVGSDPVLMLTGPIPATHRILDRAGLHIDDIDVFEVNEAFAAIVLAWQRETGADLARVNPNGGAIALGHPLGATGVRLVTTALHELERTSTSTALITMCCGGGLGTGTIIERTG